VCCTHPFAFTIATTHSFKTWLWRPRIIARKNKTASIVALFVRLSVFHAARHARCVSSVCLPLASLHGVNPHQCHVLTTTSPWYRQKNDATQASVLLAAFESPIQDMQG
jgi:hypothetical protein